MAGWSCFLDEESPNEVPDDYRVLDNVCDGSSRTILTIAILICIYFSVGGFAWAP